MGIFTIKNFITNLTKKNRVDLYSKIVFASIPKCGTHILLRYFEHAGFEGGLYRKLSTDKEFLDHLYNMKERCYCAFHYHWTEDLSKIIKAQGIKVVFLYRDPRAQICSMLHYVMKMPEVCLYPVFTQHSKTSKERIASLIRGFDADQMRFIKPSTYDQISKTVDTENPNDATKKSCRGIKRLYGFYYKWLQDPSCFSLKFEDIIGPKGGGSEKKQLQVIRELMRFTGTPKGRLNPREVAAALYDENSSTFRKGQIDSWRNDFTPELHELFMKESGELLKQWGYLS